MAKWHSVTPPDSTTTDVLAITAGVGLSVSDIRIEHRYRPRLCFTQRCQCGHLFDAECDVIDDRGRQSAAIDFAVHASLPRTHRGCPERIARERTEDCAAPVVSPPATKPTREQLRALQHDPFVREILRVFRTQNSMPNVLTASWSDGSVFREGGGTVPGCVFTRYPDIPAKPIKAPRANWPKR